jgi:hypothetical protein
MSRSGAWSVATAPSIIAPLGRALDSFIEAQIHGTVRLDLVEKVVTSGIRGSATKVRVQPAQALDSADMISSPAPSVSS